MIYPDLCFFLLVPQSESLMEYYQPPRPSIVPVSSSGMWKFDGVLSLYTMAVCTVKISCWWTEEL